MSLKEAIADLERRGIMPLRAPSLDNTILALSRFALQYPDDLRKIILVAGTNGKGSTSKTLETLLRSNGKRTGMYSSPHLVDYRERILLNGEMVTAELFEKAWRVVRDATRDLPLSHFEMLTVMAAWIFFSGVEVSPSEFAVFEVGLGGLWDATNAIPHGTAVISRLGFDHQEILGKTLLEIARNKFGIVNQNCRVIHQSLDAELSSLKAQTIRETGSQWRCAPAFKIEVTYPENEPNIPTFVIQSVWGGAPISLAGRRGAENINLAMTAFEELGFQPAQKLNVLAQVEWPARMQRLTGAWIVQHLPCPIFLSGDHNPQGVDSLLELLQFYQWRELRLVVGVGIKKDLDEIFERLFTLKNVRIWLTQADFLGRDENGFGKWFKRCEGFYRRPLEAMAAAAASASPQDLCLVTGSLYLAGDVLRNLKTEVQI